MKNDEKTSKKNDAKLRAHALAIKTSVKAGIVRQPPDRGGY